MNSKRIFLLVNLSLLATAGFSVYYLVNASYASPPEIKRATQLVGLLKNGGKTGTSVATADSPYKELRTLPDFMAALFAITPTETPTPAPTDTPVSLGVMTDSWLITEIDAGYVGVTDQRTAETFELQLNGEGKVVDFQGHQMTVKLCGVDLNADPPKATFCGDGAQVEKNY